ncbi:MAG: ATP-binding cassette domain-containing protein [Chloroflexota bacterium]|nr:ATP-binding cassette domain-containing protein [Chloroflexota bacterium]MDQ5867836.1 ATP-binding cassette domain-containing protein [Chloroflexota bacterium]
MQTANSPAPVEPVESSVAGIPAAPAEQRDTLTSTATETAAQPPVAQIERVSKQFKGVAALRGVSFNLERGEIFGLLGPNGAGKSTLLKLLLGFLHGDGGSIKLFGSTDLTKAHARIGYLPEQPRYHGNFSGREYMEFQARLAGLRGRDAKAITTHALKQVGLEEAANRRIRTYSKGMRQRLGLAVAVYASGDTPPELLVLDEPGSGLAPEGQVAVREVLLDCNRQGSTILLCSHQLTEVERICSRVGILRGGKLVALTRLDDQSRVVIVAAPRSRGFELAPHLIEYLRNLHPAVLIKGGLLETEPLVVSLPTGNDVPHAAAMKAAALRAIVDARWDVMSLHVENRDLESIYMRAVRPSRKDGADTQADAKAAEAVELPPGQSASSTSTVEAASQEAQTSDVAQAGPSQATEPVIVPDAALQSEPVEVVPASQPLLVRPVSPNGSAAPVEAVEVPEAPPASAAVETPPVAARSGPSTAPLPSLPDSIATQADPASQGQWLRDLRREGS